MKINSNKFILFFSLHAFPLLLFNCTSDTNDHIIQEQESNSHNFTQNNDTLKYVSIVVGGEVPDYEIEQFTDTMIIVYDKTDGIPTTLTFFYETYYALPDYQIASYFKAHDTLRLTSDLFRFWASIGHFNFVVYEHTNYGPIFIKRNDWEIENYRLIASSTTSNEIIDSIYLESWEDHKKRYILKIGDSSIYRGEEWW